MPGTRIFVNANMYGNDFVFTIKNVSEFEIDFTEEEILSRFVRGDKARHSEGNGLGLSIAKSFTEQCGGSFAVSLDDDMFKVIIRLR
jgi:signal transduction histidine kinase